MLDKETVFFVVWMCCLLAFLMFQWTEDRLGRHVVEMSGWRTPQVAECEWTRCEHGGRCWCTDRLPDDYVRSAGNHE